MEANHTEAFFEQYSKVSAEKSGILPLWQEIAEFTYPGMANFQRYITNNNPDATRTHRPIYDATAEHALDLFASSTMSLLCNPASKWLMIESESEELRKNHEVQVFLDELQDLALSRFNSPSARFYDNIFLSLKSVGAFGLCPVLMDINDDGILSFKAETPKMYNFEEDFSGNIRAHYLEYEYDYSTLIELRDKKGWSLPGNLDKDTKHTVIRKIWRNSDYNEELGGYNYAKYQSCHYHKAEKHKLHQDFFNENPVAVARWDKISGSKWNDSPARVALADIKLINATQRDVITSLERMLHPPLAVASESQVGTIDLSPNATMVVNGDPRAAITPIYTTGDVPSIIEWQNLIRESIRTSFYINIFQTATRADMTATEAQIRKQEDLRGMAPKITRLQTDLIDVCVQRQIQVILESGIIKVPESLRENPNLKVQYATPISQAYRQQELTQTMNFMQSIAAVINVETQATGQSQAVDNVDFDETMRSIADMAGVESKMLMPQDEVDEIRQARAEQQAAQQEIQTAEQLAGIAKDLPQDDKQ